MSARSVMSGFVTGEGSVHARELDPRFLGKGMDDDEVHALREEARLGCPLCETAHPWLPCEHKTRRREDHRIGEGELLVSQPDFRDSLDPEGRED